MPTGVAGDGGAGVVAPGLDGGGGSSQADAGADLTEAGLASRDAAPAPAADADESAHPDGGAGETDAITPDAPAAADAEAPEAGPPACTNVAECPVCGSAFMVACCRSDGLCGCAFVPGPCR